MRVSRTNRSGRSGKKAQASASAGVERAPLAGRVVGGVAVLALCAALPVFVNTAIGYAPLVGFVVLVALCGGYLQLTARRLDCTQQVRHREVTRGQGGQAGVALRNTTPLPMTRVEPSFVIERDDGSVEQVRACAALGPRQSRDFALGVGFEHVGTYEVGLRSVGVFDPLGLLSRTVEVGQRCRVRVVPRVVPVADALRSDPASSDAARSVRTVMSDDMDYSCVRAYQMGDPMKKVHWKMSARLEGQLFTRLYESSTNPGLTVALDFCDAGGGAGVGGGADPDPERRAQVFDTLLEVAFSLLDHAGRTGVATTLAFCDRSGAPRRMHGCTPDELNPLVDEMPRLGDAQVGARLAADLLDEELTGAQARTNLVLVAPALSQEMGEALGRQVAAHRDVRVVLAVPRILTAAERRERLAAAGRCAGEGVTVLCVGDADELARGVR